MIRNTLASLAAVSLFAGCQTTTLDVPEDAAIVADEAVVIDPREIVVIVPTAIDARRFVQRAIPLGYEVRAHDKLTSLELIMITLQMPKGQEASFAVRELKQLEPSITIDGNHGYGPQSAVQKTGALDYAAALLHWAPGLCTAAGPIGVLDTGLPDAFARMVISRDFSLEPDKIEASGHAGDILSLILSSDMLMGVQVFHADVVSPDTQIGEAAGVNSILRGLDWLMENDVRLINISLSGPYNRVLDRAFQRAAQEGVIIVSAAGNDGPGARVRYPAGFASTLAVTAIDADLQVYDRAVRGEQLDFSAPGVEVRTRAGEQRYVTGTSIAAPFVTMRIAGDSELLALEDAAAIRRALAATTRDLGEAGHDPVFGYGLISAPLGCQLP